MTVSWGQTWWSFWTPAGRDGHIMVQMRMWTLCSEIKNCQVETTEHETKQGPFWVGGPRGPSRPRTQEVRPVGSQGLGRAGEGRGEVREAASRSHVTSFAPDKSLPPPFWPILGLAGHEYFIGKPFPPISPGGRELLPVAGAWESARRPGRAADRAGWGTGTWVRGLRLQPQGDPSL